MKSQDHMGSLGTDSKDLVARSYVTRIDFKRAVSSTCYRLMRSYPGYGFTQPSTSRSHSTE